MDKDFINLNEHGQRFREISDIKNSIANRGLWKSVNKWMGRRGAGKLRVRIRTIKILKVWHP